MLTTLQSLITTLKQLEKVSDAKKITGSLTQKKKAPSLLFLEAADFCSFFKISKLDDKKLNLYHSLKGTQDFKAIAKAHYLRQTIQLSFAKFCMQSNR